jgi:hypothetical protein
MGRFDGLDRAIRIAMTVADLQYHQAQALLRCAKQPLRPAGFADLFKVGIGHLLSISCIERNVFGAIKAIAAVSLALRGDGVRRVIPDQVIETMRQTARETSRGGLATNVR